jgi:uncharacterized peroxidase-related enzyme
MTTTGRFTADELVWYPRLEPVDTVTATAEQTEALTETTRTGQPSPYYRLLAHAPAALRSRTRLYNHVMYARGGLPRVDRELAATAASMTNGCVYCVSVHARRLAQLARDPDLVAGLLGERPGTLTDRQRGIVDFARKLTSDPAVLDAEDIRPLHLAGLAEPEIVDLICVVALFGWANRLMQSLGDPHPA